MSYFNRPLLVRKSLNSILLASEYHQDWELAFGDDNSKFPGKPIVEDVLKDHLGKINFYNSGLSFEEKIKRGLILGELANQAIQKSDAEVGIILQDDDQLVPTYLKKLSDFFLNNPKVMYGYSKVHIYNPLYEDVDNVDNLDHKYNKCNMPVNPVNNIDASQLAFRLSCCKEYDAWFGTTTLQRESMPWAKDTDKTFFENLYEKLGDTSPIDVVGQYKAIHEYQLLWHKKTDENGLRHYCEMIESLAGKEF